MSAYNFDRDLTFAGKVGFGGLSSVTGRSLDLDQKVVTDGTINDAQATIFRNGTSVVTLGENKGVRHGVNMSKPNDADTVLYRLKGFSYSPHPTVVHTLFFGIIQEAPAPIEAGQTCLPYQVLKIGIGIEFDETVAIPWSDDILGTDVSNRQLTFGVGVLNYNSQVGFRWSYHLSVQALDKRPPDYISEMR